MGRHGDAMAGRVENLRPFKKGEARAKAAGRKGGKAVQAANLERRTLREWAELLRDAQAPGKGKLTNGQKAVLAMFKAAGKGSPKAFAVLADVLGERKAALSIGLDLPTIIDDVPRSTDPVRPDAAPEELNP